MTQKEIKWLLSAALCLALSFTLGLKWEKLLVLNHFGERDIQYTGPFDDNLKYIENRTDHRTESGTAQKIYKEANILKAYYKFTNFSKDIMSVNYEMDKAVYLENIAKYGYRKSELDKLSQDYKAERNAIWQRNLVHGKEAALKAIKISDGDYDTRIRTLLYSRGLSLKAATKTIEPDVPQIVKRNSKLMKNIAVKINHNAKQKGYGSEEIIGTVLSFVQTAVIYKIPPLVEKNGVHIAGIFPPFRTLLTGWGDCDTKSALAGAILKNWSNVKMVGIAVPGHYLTAVRRLPAKGDAFIRYKGLEYVLLEPAGPAWLPIGTVGQGTKDLLARGSDYKIEPFFD